ncbi:hypothetical protein M408DRAFT_331011 [Serendipita vermifera MAFF 305830]|uniref:Integral membrane protein n=1 Tax=Serendipita vermifera MAFF 305830 TaxID=933852 RepID=A0A0C3B2A7_SERVB|nr:hypothetical protein M408DRAFT_331011 [Serendipita vermifera MAFF 305830]
MWFLNRYLPLACVCVRIWAMAYAVPPDIVCKVAIQFTAWTGLVSVAIVDILLMLRVWALYNGSRFVKWFLIGVFVVGFPAAIGVRQAPPVAGIPLVTPAPLSLTVCRRSPPSELFSLFTMATVIDTIIFGMVIYRAGGQRFRSQTPMLAVLVRDGALYYAAITAVLLFMIAATFIPLLYQPVADANLNVPLSALACSRLILSLRGVYFRQGDGARTDMQTISTTYQPKNRPPHSTRAEDDIRLGNIRSPALRSDFQGGGISRSNRRDDPLKSMDYDWEPESYTSRNDVERGSLGDTNASKHSRRRSRSMADMFPSNRELSPQFGVPAAQVTVTRTTTAVADDGVPFEFPADNHVEKPRLPSQPEETKGGMDWWDSSDGTDSGAPSRTGVFETRVGYRHDRVPDDFEAEYGSPKSPRSL